MHTCHSRHDLRHPLLEPLDKRSGRIVKHRHRVHLRNSLIVVIVVRHGSCFPAVFTSSSSRSLILVSALVLWAHAQSKLGKRSCKRVLHDSGTIPSLPLIVKTSQFLKAFIYLKIFRVSTNRSHGVTVSTLDSESNDPSSNSQYVGSINRPFSQEILGGTLNFFFSCLL